MITHRAMEESRWRRILALSRFLRPITAMAMRDEPLKKTSLSRSSVIMAMLRPRVPEAAASAAVGIANGGVLVRMIDRLFRMAGEGWRTAWLRAAINRVPSGDLSDREHAVWLGGWVALSAIATRILLVGLDGLLDPPPLGLGWLAAAPFAVACVVKPAAVVTAWRQWRRKA